MIEPRIPPTHGDVAGHYDELDAFYREVWGEHLHHGLWRTGRESVDEAVRALVDLVAQRADIGPGDRVVDVGMGYGGTSRVLATDYGAQVTGLTVSARQHAVACSLRREADNPRYLLSDWLENRLPPASADAVVSIECVGHVDDKARFFEEVGRVLVRGGRLGLTAWLAGPDPTRWQVRHLLEPICREGRLSGLPTARELEGWATEAGLVVEGMESLGKAVRRTWSVVSRRILLGIATRPRYARYLLDGRARERSFVRTLFRMGPAYRTGALDYGLLWGRRP